MYESPKLKHIPVVITCTDVVPERIIEWVKEKQWILHEWNICYLSNQIIYIFLIQVHWRSGRGIHDKACQGFWCASYS